MYANEGHVAEQIKLAQAMVALGLMAIRLDPDKWEWWEATASERDVLQRALYGA